MSDKWVAECSPCTWGTLHDTQDEAIAAAEEHVDELHRKIPAAERASNRMGHVQFRTVTAADRSLAQPPTVEQGPAELPGREKPTEPAPKDATSYDGEHTETTGEIAERQE